MKNTLNPTQITYSKKLYKNKKESQICDEVKALGFMPILVSNTADYEYHPHAHSEAKLLAIVEGSIVVFVGEKSIECSSGDLLIIPGEVIHSAKVSRYGCRFFWSEKLV